QKEETKQTQGNKQKEETKQTQGNKQKEETKQTQGNKQKEETKQTQQTVKSNEYKEDKLPKTGDEQNTMPIKAILGSLLIVVALLIGWTKRKAILKR
ncbi:LPXTG cell wall anchor domain-containing protein, partial [Bacillus safensis]|nr:LPXTG cell wall anchor domain-containing protein [Bacillus safensis]